MAAEQDSLKVTMPIIKLLTKQQIPVEDYRLIAERRFTRSNNTENYAGGSVSSS
jgi:hypothetical protein